jgi:hypothetical protein
MAYLEVEIADLAEVLAGEDRDEVAVALVDKFETADLIVGILEQYDEEQRIELIGEIIGDLCLSIDDVLPVVTDLAGDEDLMAGIVDVVKKRCLLPEILEVLWEMKQ